MEQDITIYLAKAEESLRTAESEFANGRYNSCANRCYYACLQAAIAALLSEGIRPRAQWSHAFVQGQFVGVFINQRHLYAGPFSFRKEIANQAQNELKGFVLRGASLPRHAPMTQNPCRKADAHDTTAPSAHRDLL